MRIAISGTHCCGKSTLIDSFLAAHGDYVHEAEPYEMLQELHGEAFGAEPTAEDFFRQLEYHVERLRQYSEGDRVICERGPADFVAYLLALDDLGRDTADASLVRQSIEIAGSAVKLLDLMVYIPATGQAPASEDPELRSAVDHWLEEILLNDEFGMFTGHQPLILEISGTTPQRLRTIEAAAFGQVLRSKE
jgi:AAA domain-containing protein